VQWEQVRDAMKMAELSKELEKFKHIQVDGVEINLNDEIGKGAGSEDGSYVHHLDGLARLSAMNEKIAAN